MRNSTQERLSALGLISNVLKDVPQLVIQVAVIALAGTWSQTTVLSLLVTLVMLLLAVLKRGFGWVLHHSQQSSALHKNRANIALNMVPMPSTSPASAFAKLEAAHKSLLEENEELRKECEGLQEEGEELRAEIRKLKASQ